MGNASSFFTCIHFEQELIHIYVRKKSKIICQKHIRIFLDLYDDKKKIHTRA